MSHYQYINAPSPDLRIVPTASLQPHEFHDSQRSAPLVERLRHEAVVINPPLVAPMEDAQFVIMDGANRCYAFTELGYVHSLVQVMPYDSGYVELETWSHVVGGWNLDEFLHQLHQLPDIELIDQQDKHAIAHIMLPDGHIFGIDAAVETTHERNAALQHVVGVYQQRARLHRTAAREPADIWTLYPDAIALVVFPRYEPADIVAAARYKAYLPPGISRHIVHGRAIRVNYPIERLRDQTLSLDEKNQHLKQWLQNKLANRQVRYYAEATYQFDE